MLTSVIAYFFIVHRLYSLIVYVLSVGFGLCYISSVQFSRVVCVCQF